MLHDGKNGKGEKKRDNSSLASTPFGFDTDCRQGTNLMTTYWDFGHCKSSPVTGLDWPRGFQEVKVPRFHDNGTGRW